MPEDPTRRRPRSAPPSRALPGLLLTAVAGCRASGPSLDTDRVVDGVLMPTLRASHELEPPPTAAEGEAGGRGGTIDLELTGVSDRFTDGGVPFEVEVLEGIATWSPGWLHTDTVRLDPCLGLRYRMLDFSTGGPPAQDGTRSELDPVIGVQARWRPLERLELMALADTSWPFEAELRVELTAGFQLTDTVQLLAGYRWWHVEVAELVTGDYDVRFEGIVLGMGVRF